MVYFVGKILSPDHPKKYIVEGRDSVTRGRKQRKRKGQRASKWQVGPSKMCPFSKCKKLTQCAL